MLTYGPFRAKQTIENSISLLLFLLLSACFGSGDQKVAGPIDNSKKITVGFEGIVLAEGETKPFNIQLNKESSEDLSLKWTITGNDASTRFQFDSGTVGITKGSTSLPVVLSVNEDSVYNPDISYTITIEELVDHETFFDFVSQDFLVTDNDPKPSLSFTASTSNIGEAGGQVSISADLDSQAGKPVTVTYTIEGASTATETSDFTQSGSFSFPALATNSTFNIPIVNDVDSEGDETVVIKFATITYDSILLLIDGSKDTHTLTINDDELTGIANPSAFRLVDRSSETGFPAQVGFTSEREVLIEVDGDTDAVKWCVSVLQTTKPTNGSANCVGGVGPDSGWYTSDPESLDSLGTGADLELANTDGNFTYYIWVANASDEVNVGPVTASVVLDQVKPTPSVTQSSAQPDPASAYNINFDIEFGEPIEATSFTSADIQNRGLARTPSFVITNPADVNVDTIYGIGISSVLSNGNLILRIPENQIFDRAGNGNVFSVDGADNLVSTNFPEGTDIYRSVGPGNTTALKQGSDDSGINLKIRNSVALFDKSIPLNVGVGDAIEYDSDNNGSLDKLAFIVSRLGMNHYVVQDEAGAAVSSLSIADQDWKIYRAYTSLANAESGTVNSSIGTSFDSWSGGKNLVTSGENWNIALYADAPDTTAVTISGWTTNGFNHISLFVPQSSKEVGVSQRHKGKWDTSFYHLTQAGSDSSLLVSTGANFTEVIGLQIESRTDGAGKALRSFAINPSFISNVVKRGAGGGVAYGLRMEGTSPQMRLVANNLFDGFDGTSDQSINPSGASIEHMSFIYNNTVVNCHRGAVSGGNGSTIVAINNIAQCANTTEFNTIFDPSSDYNVSSDTSAPGTNSVQNASVNFVNSGAKDFKLALADTTAINKGIDISTLLGSSLDILGNKRLTWDAGAFAANLTDDTWVGTAADGNWATASNWHGGVVPGSSDSIHANYLCGSNCDIDVPSSITITNAQFDNTYVGVFAQDPGASITINENYSQHSGDLLGDNSPFRVRGSFHVENASVTWNNSDFETFGNISSAIDARDIVFNNVTFSKSSTGNNSLRSNMDVNGNFLGTKTGRIDSDYGRIFLSGDLSLVDGNGGTSEIVLNGSTQQITGTSGKMIPALRVSSTGTVNFTSGTSLGLYYGYTYESGTVNWNDATLEALGNVSTYIDAGGQSIANVLAKKTSSGTVNFVGDTVLLGDLEVNQSQSIGGTATKIMIGGDLTITSTSLISPQLVFNSTGDQNITYTAGGIAQDIQVDKASGGVYQTADVSLPVGVDVKNGNWYMNGFEFASTGILNLEAGTSFFTGCKTPTYSALTGTGLLVGGQAIGTLGLSVSDVTVNENAGTMDFVVSAGGAFTCDGDLTFDYATSDGTALLIDGDYTSTSGSATLTAGQSQVVISVPILDDSIWEPGAGETVNLTISNNSAGSLTDAAGVGTITDNEVYSLATTFVWTGDGGSDNWSDTDNWGPDSVPTATDIVYFNSTYCTNCNVDIDASITVKGLRTHTGFAGTITQLNGQTMTVREIGWSQVAGNFIGGDSNITLENNSGNSNFYMNGGSFTSSSGVMSLPESMYILGGTASFPAGEVNLVNGNAAYKIDIGTNEFFDLRFSKNADTGSFATDAIVKNDFYLNNAGYCPSAVHVKLHGDYHLGGSGNGAEKVELVGTGNQTIISDLGSSYGFGFIINKPSGTAFLSGEIKVYTRVTYVQGTVDPQTSNVKLYGYSMFLDAAGMNFYDLTLGGLAGATLVTGTNDVLNKLTIDNTAANHFINGDTIQVHKELDVPDADGGSATVKLVGAGPHTITSASYQDIPKLEIATSGTVDFPPVLYVDQGLKYTSGTVNLNSGTIVVSGTANDASIDFAPVGFYNFSLMKSGALTNIVGDTPIVNTLTYSRASSDAGINGDKLLARGDVVLSSGGNGVAGNSTLRIEGSGNQTISSVQAAAVGKIEIASTGGTVVFTGLNFETTDFEYISGSVDMANTRMAFEDNGNGTSDINSGTVEFHDVELRNTQNVSTAVSITGTSIVRGDLTFNSASANANITGGSIDLFGDYHHIGGNNTPGTTNLNFKGNAYQAVSQSSGNVLGGKWTVDKTGGKVYLDSNVSLNVAGQDLEILNTSFRMNGFDLTVDGDLDVAGGASFLQDCGIKTVNGTESITGSLTNGQVGVPTLNVSDVSKTEGEDLDFYLEMDFPNCSVASVFTYDIENVSAVGNGVDFTSTIYSENLSMGNSDIALKRVRVNSIDDTDYENNETFNVSISSESDITLARSSAEGTILNNDSGTHIWTGLGADDNWNTALNWAGGAIPTNSDVAYFDSTCTNCDVTINVNPDVKGIYLLDAYTGTMTQAAGVTVHIGDSGFSQSGGTFVGSDSELQVDDGIFTLSKGNFTSTSGELILKGSPQMYFDSINSTFIHNSGSLRLDPVRNADIRMDINGINLNHFKNRMYRGTTIFTGSEFSVVTYEVEKSDICVSVGGKINVTGDLNFTPSSLQRSTDTTDVSMIGSANQSINGGGIYNGVGRLEINKSGGTLNFLGEFVITGGINYIAGTVNVGTSSIHMHANYNANKTIQINSGTLEFYDLKMDSNRLTNININGEIRVSNLLILDNDDTGNIYGKIVSTGNVELHDGTYDSFAELHMLGTGAQSIQYFSGSGSAPLKSLTVGASSSVTLLSDLVLNANGTDASVNNEDLHLITGATLDMGGFNLTANDALISETGTTIDKNGGVLVYDSIDPNTLVNGTVNP